MKVEFVYGDSCRPEFSDMFGGWLTEHDGRIFLIDCGVGSGGASLTARLKERLAGRPLDYVLLTHIHLDHAGGLSHVLKAWPEAKALVHAKGLRHLVEPERLWADTQKVMGEVAPVYGQLEPIAPNRFITHDQAALPGLEIFETPGHATHHLSFRLGGVMFVGEAGGCPYYQDGQVFNRPATPGRYFPKETLSSIDLLLREPDGPAYFGHTHELVPFHENLRRYRDQLLLWDEILRRPQSARRPGESPGERLERLAGVIENEDPNIRPLADRPPDDRWKERYFLKNNIEGFLAHYESEQKAAAA